MIKQLTLIVLLASSTILSAQSLWDVVEGPVPMRAGIEREIIPEAYTTYKVDMDRLRKQLSRAPMEDDSNRSSKVISVDMPQPDGSIANYTIYESPVMEAGISARYPGIRSYAGYNTVVPSEVIRFDLSEYGLRAAIRSSGGQIYIDPYALGDTEHYISYYTRDDHTGQLPDGAVLCGMMPDKDGLVDQHPLPRRTTGGEVVDLRVYRLAMAGTASWSNVRGTVERCLADVNTSVNRLNLIFEYETSIRMVVIDRNDELFFFDNEPYTNTDQGREIISQNTQILNNIVGVDSYDIGHVFSRCFDVGGIARRPSVCQAFKGAGVTCANGTNPISWAIGTLAHEVGHQFSASHIFNHCDGENESSSTGYEPGSGSTIMSYAGGCGPQLNVQSDNDDYFHTGNLREMYNYSRDGNIGDDCNVKIETGNRAPIVSLPYPNNLVIPIMTPFELTGEAEDPDGDPMTFTWEQLDAGPLSDRGNPLSNAPLFRSLYPGPSKTRVFPNLQDLAGQIPNLNEVLPTISRDVTLVFTARDQSGIHGTATWEILEMRSIASAGPFLVEYPNLFTLLRSGDEIDVTWDVANTDVPPISSTHVDILLSLDGGFTYPYELASNVPNDGLQRVVLPNETTIRARIKVKPTNSIFFDISNRNFEIQAPDQPTFLVDVSVLKYNVCLPDVLVVDLPTVAFNDYTEDITFEITDGLPAGAVVEFSPATITAGEMTQLSIDLSGVQGSGVYEMTIGGRGADGQLVERSLTLTTTGTDFTSLATIAPENGLSGQSPAPIFEWAEVLDADVYQVELATSPAFDAASLLMSSSTTATSMASSQVLQPGKVYYWRVLASNSCDQMSSPIAAFSTESLSCSTYSPASLPRVIGSTIGGVDIRIQVDQPGQVADINVAAISGEHTRVGDLRGRLTSPSGTEIILWDPRCATQQDFDMTLDDDAPTEVTCPINRGTTYQPDGLLAAFNGEEIIGEWVLRVEDNRNGNGGRVEVATLEICSNVALDPPMLVNNLTQSVGRGTNTIIMSENLRAEDNNHASDELTYTVVTAPVHGQLLVNGSPLSVGGQYTQADIDQDAIEYLHNGNDEDVDAFEFTIIDPDGGWVSITTFDLLIEGVVSTADQDLVQQSIAVFPNPTNDRVTVMTEAEEWSQAQLQIIDMQGRVWHQLSLETGRRDIDVSAMPAGIYMLRVYDGTTQVVKRLSVLR